MKRFVTQLVLLSHNSCLLELTLLESVGYLLYELQLHYQVDNF